MKKRPYLVRGFDTFSYEDWIEGRFVTEAEAISVARSKAGVMKQYCVYENDNLIHTFGKY